MKNESTIKYRYIGGIIIISKEKAIKIAKSEMPSQGFKVISVKLHNTIYYIDLVKQKQKYLVELDANTGRIVGGAGGAP